MHKSDWDGDIIPRKKCSVPLTLTLSQQETIENVKQWMTRNAYEPSTIKNTTKRLKHLISKCNTKDPENVKTYIANKQCGNAYKESLIEAFNAYMKSIGKTWNKPFYDRYNKAPKIPKEQKIDLLIANAGERMSLYLSMLKDLGTRPVELTWLKVVDIDLRNGTVNITGAKHTVGRIGKLRPNTLGMLNAYLTKKNLHLNERIFSTTSENIACLYSKMRNALARKLNDPEIHQVKLYDFRRWKATNEYHKTNNIIYVQTLLGHKDIRTTRLYAQLTEALANDDYHSAVAQIVEQARNLIENGFEYVTEMNGIKLFRKRK